jgi:hypothetical protein
MPKQKRKIVVRIRREDPYWVISAALESGLQFAMNRLEDHGVEIPENIRAEALPFMLNELLLALDVIDWDKSK